MDSQQCTWGASEEHHLLHELCSCYVSSAGAKLNWILHLLPIQAIYDPMKAKAARKAAKDVQLLDTQVKQELISAPWKHAVAPVK